jgi:Phosphotransferase enzyme family
MRLECTPPPEQRAALRTQLARLQQPGVLGEILHATAGFNPTRVTCSVLSLHPDRFVLRALVHSSDGEGRAYALKVYSDDLGERVWAYAQAVTADPRADLPSLCLPSRYIPHERMLVFPWVDGVALSAVVDDRAPELLRQAAEQAAHLHRLTVVPEHPTTAEMIVETTRARCDRLRSRWPETASIIEPLLAILDDAMAGLDPAALAPVHGDMWAGQFLWTGDRLVLLDLDTFGYTDRAYDVGHFLAQLERHRLSNPTLPASAREWPACFREAYLSAMPTVSTRNVSFYLGLTLVRKIYTVRLVQPDAAPWLLPQLARRARAALLEATSGRTAA